LVLKLLAGVGEPCQAAGGVMSGTSGSAGISGNGGIPPPPIGVLALEPLALPAMVRAAPSWPSGTGRGLLICDTYRSPA
jgi:hypothetical protein